jgi:hypothetical protein
VQGAPGAPAFGTPVQGAPGAPYAPASPQVIGSGSYQSELAPPKKKKTWIIVLVVVILLLCCIAPIATVVVLNATGFFESEFRSSPSVQVPSPSNPSEPSDPSDPPATAPGSNSWAGQVLTQNEHLKWTFGDAHTSAGRVAIDCTIENLSDGEFWVYITSDSEVNGRYTTIELDTDDIPAHQSAHLTLWIDGYSSLSEIHTLTLELDVSESQGSYDTIELYTVTFTPGSSA